MISTKKHKDFTMMSYPDFFKNTPTITLKDPLSDFLGSLTDGIVEFTYLDIVKSAGHSCPTVAGAYLSTIKGIEALYGDEMPIRGDISISLKDNSQKGVTGVISSVITQITGATETTGFKGLNGNFARHNLMEFNANIESELLFTRLDTGASVSVNYDPNSVAGNPKIQGLMGKMMQGIATKEEKLEFGKVWQERVSDIFDRADEVISVNSL